MPVMTNARINAFLVEPRIAHLVTIHPNQSPHVSPVWYAYSNGQFEIFSDRNYRKVKNINENDLTALSIAGETEPYEYISVEGHMTINTDHVKERGVSIAKRYQGAEQAELFISKYYDAETSVILTLFPTKFISWTSD